jgi:hypothetical protein
MNALSRDIRLPVAGQRLSRGQTATPASLPDALRRDAETLLALRESLGFALDLASALASMSFVRVTGSGEVDNRMPPWRCTTLEAATLVAELRGGQESPTGMLASLRPDFLIRNTASEVEDHLNRLGWHVW